LVFIVGWGQENNPSTFDHDTTVLKVIDIRPLGMQDFFLTGINLIAHDQPLIVL
jgi:hypothetical protein